MLFLFICFQNTYFKFKRFLKHIDHKNLKTHKTHNTLNKVLYQNLNLILCFSVFVLCVMKHYLGIYYSTKTKLKTNKIGLADSLSVVTSTTTKKVRPPSMK